MPEQHVHHAARPLELLGHGVGRGTPGRRRAPRRRRRRRPASRTELIISVVVKSSASSGPEAADLLQRRGAHRVVRADAARRVAAGVPGLHRAVEHASAYRRPRAAQDRRRCGRRCSARRRSRRVGSANGADHLAAGRRAPGRGRRRAGRRRRRAGSPRGRRSRRGCPPCSACAAAIRRWYPSTRRGSRRARRCARTTRASRRRAPRRRATRHRGTGVLGEHRLQRLRARRPRLARRLRDDHRHAQPRHRAPGSAAACGRRGRRTALGAGVPSN